MEEHSTCICAMITCTAASPPLMPGEGEVGGESAGGEAMLLDERQMQWWNTSQCPLLCRLLKLRTMPAWLTQQPVGAEEET